MTSMENLAPPVAARSTHAPLPTGVRQLLAKTRVPGASIALIRRGGQVESWVIGDARLDPRLEVRTDTVFHLFSGTKLYTATSVMRLVEQGRVNLDDPIQEHLPDLPLRFPITIRQLASHDSGLRETVSALLATHRHDQPTPSAAEALARFAVDTGRQPGHGVAYRNVNYSILGELISRVGARPYEQFVQAEVLGPLAAEPTFSYTKDNLERAATGYSPRFSPMRLALRLLLPRHSRPVFSRASGSLVAIQPFALDTAAIGGLIGTPADFIPLLREMLNPNDGVLTAASKREMLTTQANGAAGITSRIGVGIGWKLGRVHDVEFWNHEGGGPGFCSETRLYPADGLGMVILMNLSQSTRLSRIAHKICETLRTQSPRTSTLPTRGLDRDPAAHGRLRRADPTPVRGFGCHDRSAGARHAASNKEAVASGDVNIAVAVPVPLLGRLAWEGQLRSALTPVRAAQWGLTETAEDVDATFLADIRAEAGWDSWTLWTLPAAAVHILLGFRRLHDPATFEWHLLSTAAGVMSSDVEILPLLSKASSDKRHEGSDTSRATQVLVGQ
ncbi:MAG: beta-lactamase family protein [bacterium]|nr:beta-lactamase family protein [bacterium]